MTNGNAFPLRRQAECLEARTCSLTLFDSAFILIFLSSYSSLSMSFPRSLNSIFHNLSTAQWRATCHPVIFFGSRTHVPPSIFYVSPTTSRTIPRKTPQNTLSQKPRQSHASTTIFYKGSSKNGCLGSTATERHGGSIVLAPFLVGNLCAESRGRSQRCWRGDGRRGRRRGEATGERGTAPVLGMSMDRVEAILDVTHVDAGKGLQVGVAPTVDCGHRVQ
jgi:hypothetical protein